MTRTRERMAKDTEICSIPYHPVACGVLGLFLVFFGSCAGPAEGRAGGGRESMTTISCKNESAQKLADARVLVDGQAFGFGVVSPRSKKAMGAGDIANAETFMVIYTVHPAHGAPESTGEQAVEYPGSKLAALAKRADELEAVYFGDGRWAMRVYERGADTGKSVIWEMAMTEAMMP